MTTKNDAEELDKVMYSYTTEGNQLEEENKILKETINHLKNEIDRIREPALMVCEVVRVTEDNTAVIKVPNGNKFLVNVSSTCKNIKPGDEVLCEQKNLTILKIVENTKKFNVEQFVIIEKPKISWKDIGGLKDQIEDVKEVVELPLKKPELFKKVGINPPKGILLYGPPGTGKTLLAKAVAKEADATFIEIVGSELVQKFIGEGAKLVKEVFELARQKGPSIIFIDEIDALAAKRIELGTSGEREVQRTFMQFLAELDGFKSLDNVKVIGCTNRKDILDPAILRPGRLDRLINVPNPDKEGLKQIFKIHTRNMKIEKRVKIEKIHNMMKDFSGAEIKAVTTEAGYFAIRENRTSIKEKDFINAVKKVKKEEEEHGTDYLHMFG
ncbi:MAG: proteasome-activating nucleotidase [Minisyncoccales bacterium]